jgi:putative addiction module killer protein
MEVLPIRIYEYALPDGRRPFPEWVEHLGDRQAKDIIFKRLGRLKSGNFGDCKVIESIIELRIDHGPGYRIYCGKKKDTIVVLLIGGTKKSQESDIQTAKSYWADYQKRASP